MESKKFDFYEYGRKMAGEFFDVQVATAKEIGKKYGKEARLCFEAGIAETIGIMSNDLMNADTNLAFDENVEPKTIITADNLRNNSYFGEAGVSYKTDAEGNYNVPKKGMGK